MADFRREDISNKNVERMQKPRLEQMAGVKNTRDEYTRHGHEGTFKFVTE